MDKKFDEDVDVCEKTAYIEKKAAEEKQQKKLEKIWGMTNIINLFIISKCMKLQLIF